MATPIVLSKTYVNGAWAPYYPQTSAAAVITSAEARFVTDAQIAEFTAKATTQNVNDALVEAKQYADDKVAALVDGAPEALDTLNELATALQSIEGAYDGLLTVIGQKAEKTYVDDQLALKADQTAVDAALALKADTDTVNAALDLKADEDAVNSALALKASTEYVDIELAKKANIEDVTKVTLDEEEPTAPKAGDLWLEVLA